MSRLHMTKHAGDEFQVGAEVPHLFRVAYARQGVCGLWWMARPEADWTMITLPAESAPAIFEVVHGGAIHKFALHCAEARGQVARLCVEAARDIPIKHELAHSVR